MVYFLLKLNSKGILRLERYIPRSPRLHHPFISRPVLVLIARIPRTTSDPVARMHATRPIATRLEGDRNRFSISFSFPSLRFSSPAHDNAIIAKLVSFSNGIIRSVGRGGSRERRIVLPIALFQPDCALRILQTWLELRPDLAAAPLSVKRELRISFKKQFETKLGSVTWCTYGKINWTRAELRSVSSK